MNDIRLTDEQAALFILFMKYYDTFGFLVSQGVFDVRRGSAELHFGEDGLSSVQIKTLHKFPALQKL